MSLNASRPVAVLGAGSWGTALAYSLSEYGGHRVRMWARRPSLVESLDQHRRNVDYLPSVELPRAVSFTSDLGEAISEAELIVFATPSQAVRAVARQIAPRVTREHVVISVAKGIEVGTLMTTSGVLRDALPDADADRIGVLYGPSHAEEVGMGQPTTVVVAVPDVGVATQVQRTFLTDRFRVYVNADLVGVEVAGSVKNVMAIAAGPRRCAGRHYRHGRRSAPWRGRRAAGRRA